MNLPTTSGVTRLRNLLWISSALLVVPLAVGSCAKEHPHEEAFTVEGRYEALTVTPSTTFESLHFTKSGRYHGTLANCAAVVCDELGSYELDASRGALRLSADGGAKRSFAIQRTRAGAEAPSTSTQSLHAATLHPRTSSAEVASTDDDPCLPGDGEDGDADSSAADVTSLLSGSGSTAVLADCSALLAAGIAEGFELSNVDPATKSPDGVVGADLVTLLRRGSRDSNGCSAALNQPGTCRSDVSVEGTLLIAFDGTGNHLEQNDVIAQMFSGVATTGGEPVLRSYRDSAHASGAKANQDWAYVSYASFDDLGRVRSLYYNGPPEGPTSLRFDDSGASFIYDEAMRDGPHGDLCKAVADPVTKKVFLVGYSRGAVMAHRAAIAIMSGTCGYGMGAKVTWLGLVDPVASGMDQDHVATEDCTDDARRYHVRDNAQTEGCLALVRSTSTGAPVPVSVLTKTTEANIAADDFLLSTIPVNGARVKVFDFAGTAVSVHVAMGRSGIVETALRAAGANVGGLRYR